MLLPQFPGMAVNPAYARQVLHRSGAAGRCTEGVIEPAARRVSPLPRSTRRAPLIDNASGQSPQTTYAHAGEPEEVLAGPRAVVRVRTGTPDGRRGKDATRHRAECGVAATSEHPDHTLVATGIRPQYTSIFHGGGGQIGTGLDRWLQPFATLRRTRATRGWGPLGAGPGVGGGAGGGTAAAVVPSGSPAPAEACNALRRIPCATWDAALCVANRGAGI